ncbi:uncharacterized protein LOC125950847 [Anopheles darlingi]|uniref:Putative u8-agatoxin-ao1a-like isoform 1 n=1 Tax=Anopheles darlingi TaxID=43151 RepID=A0A2M4DND9_ANODA|nr:uncharacterized protein LOC125950847 [Anopheles darlingi]
MHRCTVGRLLIWLVIAFLAAAHGASNYLYDSDERYPPSATNVLEDSEADDGTDRLSLADDGYLESFLQPGASKRSSLIQVYRRGCIPRGGNCDHRLNDCCHKSSCRCNLWGSNCRCQRMGLFQKWG